MILSYIKTALRSLKRNKASTFINVFGLTLGIACSIIIFQHVRTEFSYDRHHSNFENIYRLTEKVEGNGTFFTNYAMPLPLAEALRIDFPEMAAVTVVEYERGGLLSVALNDEDGNASKKKFLEQTGIAYIEPEFFNIFDAEWIHGNPKDALSAPNQAVISESLALKIFGSTDIVGKQITYSNTFEYTIRGVVKDFPKTTDIPITFFMSFETFKKNNSERYERWGYISTNTNVYLRLDENDSPTNYAKSMFSFVKKYNEFEKEGVERTYEFQPLADLHFNDSYGLLEGRVVPKTKLYSLLLIALFLLIIASINFVNIITAQATRRSKEIGIRKVLGSGRNSLIIQLLTEIGFVAVTATVLAVVLVEISLPFLSYLLEMDISISYLNDPTVLLLLTGLALFVTATAGIYPAIMLSGFKPIVAMESKLSTKTGGGLILRRSLVVFQFVIAQVLIIATVVVLMQLNYFKTKDPGFKYDSVVGVYLPNSDSLTNVTIQERLSLINGVEKVSLSFTLPMSGSWWYQGIRKPTWVKEDEKGAEMKVVDYNFMPLYDIDIIAGRNIREGEEWTNVLVNETFLDEFDFESPEAIINQRLITDDEDEVTVVGVVRDYHSHPLQREITPCMLFNEAAWADIANIKISSGSNDEVFKEIEAIWTEIFPDYVFSIRFLDESIKKHYNDEVLTARLFNIFSGIAIFIGCLGLYGLISFIAERKTKEIGIRKVLGASMANIMGSFTKEFGILLVLAFLIAVPIGYFLMESWLEDFAYKITLHPTIFMVAGLTTFLVATAAIVFRAYRAASANPVDSLKYE